VRKGLILRNGFLVVLLLTGYGAVAQELPVSVIDSTGIATVDTVPTYVEFWFHAAPQGASHLEAMTAALDFEGALRRALDDAGMKPADLVFESAAIPDIMIKEARASARLRLSAAVFSSPESGMRDFAAFCDTIDTIARKLECQPEGPFLGVENTESIEEAAIGRATEKAYPAARAVAQILNGQIVAVDRVSIESVLWNNAPDTNASLPSIRRIACTARVQVTYTLTPVEL